jgi:hypothetical protein
VFNKEWLSSGERTDPFSTGYKPSLIKRENEGSALFDCVCVCRFVGNELTAEGDLLPLTIAATGFDYPDRVQRDRRGRTWPGARLPGRLRAKETRCLRGS